MRGELQLQIQVERDSDANHRALRRCYSCGSYARPFDDVNGSIRCERCAKRARPRPVAREEDESREPGDVNFLV